MSLDLDITYILVLALFLVPLAVLNGLVFRPFLRLFEERHEQLEGAVTRAERMLNESRGRADLFEQKIQVATRKGLEARNAIRAKAQDEMNAAIDEERKKLADKLAASLTELEKTRRTALADVHVEAERIAELAATKLLGREI